MSGSFLDAPLSGFLSALASGSATPGGGSVAALTGAQAAGLVAMVCNLTIGKKAYAAFEGEARELLAQAEARRAELAAFIQADTDAFDELMAAYKLPKASDDEIAARKAAIQAATMRATEVPLAMAAAARAVLPLCGPLAQHGSRTAVSDVGAAALAVRAAVPTALLNVEINLASIDDAAFAERARAQAAALVDGLDEQVAEVLATVRARIAG
ncbi:cyclodeaminase/cyclohydrolase family protein [Kouleothrix sp.]|uniref:cyclodeaminase/cyclohydrolase family protein n=1 Tax=Kouleothrix sp. TaxID=2779161 RepID=UPI003918E240